MPARWCGRATGRLVAIGLAVAVLASACIGGGDDGGGRAGGGGGKTGGGAAVRIGLAGDLVVDPAAASLASPAEQMVIDLLYDGLTALDAQGRAQPALAAELEHDKALTHWRITLRDDATFSDESAVTAKDVVASIEHVAAGGDGSLSALALEPIVGFRAFVDGKARHIKGLSAPAPHTVRIATTSPFSVLPTLLASPALGITKVAALGDVHGPGDLDDLPLSGSFAVTKAGDDEVQLRSPDGFAGTTEVALRVYDDDVAAYNAFDDGDLDWVMVPPAAYDDAVDAHGTDAFAPFQAELFFGMNLAREHLANRDLRSAIATAIDRDAIADDVYSELADPLATIVPAGIPGHDGDRCAPCEPDPAAAKALVKKAYPKGKVPTITIDYDESPAQTAMAKAIADDLDAVGIPTKLHPMSLDDYKEFVVSGKQELFTFGWIGAFTSPDAYLSRLFQSSSDDNLTAYRSARVDALLAQARKTTNRQVQMNRWASAEAEVAKGHVVVPIVQFRTQAILSDRIEGWHQSTTGAVDWTTVTVDG